MSNSDLRRAWKAQQATKQDVTNAMPALMGNGHGVVQVPNQPGYVYIRLGQGDLGQAYNNRCPLADNLAIYVGYDPVLDPDRRIFQVLSVRMADYAGAGGTPTPNVPPHHLTHEYGGGDDVYVSWRRLMGFRVGRPSGFQVTVDEGVIIRAGAWLAVAAQTLDLTALKPGGALGCYVLIVLNAAGTATATAGASVGIGTLDISDCPIPGASQIPLAAVRLYGAQTSIGDTPTAPDIVDLRFPQAMSTGDVHLEDLSDYARGHIIRGGAADWESYHAANAGFIVQGDGTDVKSLQFDWDVFSAGAGADMVHDHTSNAEGGTLSGVIPNRFIVPYNYCMTPATQYRIGLATGYDERHVATTLEPAINLGAGGAWDDNHVKDPCILDVDGVLWLYYAGQKASNLHWGIGLARSYDGGATWTKYAGNPILDGSVGWENDAVVFPSVLYDLREADPTKRWKMWYGGDAGAGGIGYAYSSDGLSWTKYGSNPVVALGGAGTWEDEAVYPGAIIRLGDLFYFFYNGRHTTAGVLKDKGGLITFTSPTGTYTKSANNPILVTDEKYTTLSANVVIGNTSINVADSSVFPIGCRVWVFDAANKHYLSRVASITDATHVVLSDAAPVAVSSVGGYVASYARTCVIFRSAVYDKGWRFGLSPYRVEGCDAYFTEVSGLGYSDDLTSVRIDYGAGLLIPIAASDSTGANTTRENPCLLPLWRDDDRYTSSPIPIHTHATNPQGGKLTQANTHESPDTDAATTSLHHTIGVTATTAAAGNHTHASGGDHLHGLARWLADGGATFELPDVAEYLEWATDNGTLQDQLTVSLATSNTQLVFDVAPTADHVIQAEYVIERV